MRFSFVLLFLLWANVEVSVSQKACLKLPDVPHAQVSDITKKAEYLEGHVIHFTCESGYMSNQTPRYVCTSGGWVEVRQGACYSCAMLPHVPRAFVSQETNKPEYHLGDVIHFACESGYISRQTITYVCLSDGWVPVRQGTCYSPASRCESPPEVGGRRVTGLPGSNELLFPEHILTFSCDAGKHLRGSSVLVCGEDGQWSSPFPSCEEITCKAKDLTPPLRAIGLPVVNNTAKVGHRVGFYCNQPYTMVGAENIQCLQSGEWDHPFPTCSERCVVKNLPSNIRITTQGVRRGDQLNQGQKIRFACTSNQDPIKGSAELTCQEQGQWSAAFPTCEAPLRCAQPPHLADGDIEGTVKFSYSHNEKVTYVCQAYYIMENAQNTRTCSNGQWVGSVRCLRPCLVNRDDMNRNNIKFEYRHDDKLYSTHKDFITFICLDGRTHDGRLAMRQQCIDGVMNLPTCI